MTLETPDGPATPSRNHSSGTANHPTPSGLFSGAWESARKRGRVKLPLDIDDNPLDATVEGGDLVPEPAED